jgi:hypothetical protein
VHFVAAPGPWEKNDAAFVSSGSSTLRKSLTRKICKWRDLEISYIRGVIQNKLQTSYNFKTIENSKKLVRQKLFIKIF